MRILCTNDDGIHADGLKVLEDIARALSDDVWVIAPELDQSGVSHSLSLNDPLRLREISPRHYAVRGTPTDCVLMGAYHIMKDKRPDLVLSGVNRGRNVAEDISYSGTIAGATEGAILGLPSFAFSQETGPATRKEPRWDCAREHGPGVIRKVLANGIPPDTVINVNFPACAANEVAGVKVARQGRRPLNFLRIEERFDGRHNPYYWIGFSAPGKPKEAGEGTDIAALTGNYVSVTPLRLDRTDDNLVTTLAAAFS